MGLSFPRLVVSPLLQKSTLGAFGITAVLSCLERTWRGRNRYFELLFPILRRKTQNLCLLLQRACFSHYRLMVSDNVPRLFRNCRFLVIAIRTYQGRLTTDYSRTGNFLKVSLGGSP